MANFNMFRNPNGRFSKFVISILGLKPVIKSLIDSDPRVREWQRSRSRLGASSTPYEWKLYSQLLSGMESTREVYERLETIRHHYLVKSILQILSDDALAIDPSTNKSVTIRINDSYMKSKAAQEAADQFMEDLGICNLLESVIADAIFWGEYYLRNQGDAKNGITEIFDDHLPGTMFAIYENQKPKEYFDIDITNFTRINTYDKNEIWHLGIFPRKMRFSVNSQNTIEQNFLSKDAQLVSNLRVGEPLFLDVFNKILELEALEQADMARMFGDIRRNSLVGVQAPAGLTLDQLKEFSQWYEDLINGSGFGLEIENVSGLEVIKQMMADLSNARVLPQQPDRGRVTPLNLKISGDGSAPRQIQDLREVICHTIGVPIDFIMTQGGKRGDRMSISIRQQVRYSRLLKKIQNGICDSTQRQIAIHLANNGFEDIAVSDITVKCYNSINISELDKLEFQDATITMVRGFKTFVDDLKRTEGLGEYVNMDEMAKYMKTIFNTLPGSENVIAEKKFSEAKNDMGSGAVNKTVDIMHQSSGSSGSSGNMSTQVTKKTVNEPAPEKPSVDLELDGDVA